MPSITEIFRSLGNDRAVANAHHEVRRAEREAWLVASLTQRLDSLPSTAAPAALPGTASQAA